jgi:glycosyltransferase involved in cell wall biosynthesis
MLLRLGVDARCLLAQTPRGEGLSLLYLYQAIRVLRPDWAFHFFTTQAEKSSIKDSEALDAQIHALELPGYRFQSWERVALPYMARKARLDVFHHFSSMAAGKVGCPSIGTVHDVIPLLFDHGAYGLAFKQGLMRLLSTAKAVIAPSASTLADLKRIAPQANSAAFSSAPWGVSLPPMPPSPVGSGLLMFGGSAPRKNTRLGLEGFALSRYAAGGGRLTIIGIDRAEFREQLGREAQALDVLQQIELRGYVPDDERIAALRATRSLLFPSSYEGFGLPVLEALACGKPAICSPVSSIPEVGGAAAHYFTVGDKQAMAAAIDAVMLDDEHYSTLQRECAAQSQRFSWRATAQHYIDVIEKVHVQYS